MHGTVLVIDRSADLSGELRSQLAGERLEVVHASTGEAGLDMLRERSVDLIVAAADLTGVTALDICRRVQGNAFAGAVPVIVVADTTNQEEKVLALNAGAVAYVVKPLDAAEVHARVRAGLAARQLQRELEQQNNLLYQIHEFSLKLNTLETVEETLEATLICAVSLTFSRSASILFPDETGQWLRVARALTDEGMVTPEYAARIDGSVIGTAYRSNDVRVVNDGEPVGGGPAPDQRCLHRPPYVSVPIASEAGSLGVLNVADKVADQGYTDQDVRILRCLATTAAVAIESQRRRLHLDRTRDAALVGLAGLAEWRDPETGDHLHRLRAYSKLLAEGLQRTEQYGYMMDREFVNALHRSIPLHDIGKVGIPDHILLKPGKLTPSEYEVMKTHTVVGAKVLQAMSERITQDSFLDMGRDIARHHHERWDGSGYPDGLAGEAIPLAARITAVGDVYDALASDRVYRKAWPHDEVIRYIQANSGSHFDPDIVAVLSELEAEFFRRKGRLATAEALRRVEPQRVVLAPA